MAWNHFDIVPTPPNTIDELTNIQLVAIGDQYTLGVNAYQAYLSVLTDPIFLGINNLKYHVYWVYATLDKLQSYSAELMNGVYDGGNTPPIDATELKGQLDTVVTDPDIEQLGTGQLSYSVDLMILWSKSTGDGDWVYYQAEVTA